MGRFYHNLARQEWQSAYHFFLQNELFLSIGVVYVDRVHEVAGPQLVGDSTSQQTSLVVKQHLVREGALGHAGRRCGREGWRWVVSVVAKQRVGWDFFGCRGYVDDTLAPEICHRSLG